MVQNIGIGDISAPLKRLRKAKGLNQEDLARALGVRKTTISNYETGYSCPKNSMLRKIADYFEVSISELLGEPTFVKTVLGEGMAEPLEAVAKQVPVFSSGSAFTGAQPLYVLQLPAVLLGEGECFALKIAGDSMDRAGLSDGSVAIIRKQNLVVNGEITAVVIDGLTVVRRLYVLGNSISLVSESTNPLYQPLMVDVQSADFKVLGKVIKVIETVR